MRRELVTRRSTDTMDIGTRHNDRRDNGTVRQRIGCKLLKESVKNNREISVATAEGRLKVYTRPGQKNPELACNHDTNHAGNTWTKTRQRR